MGEVFLANAEERARSSRSFKIPPAFAREHLHVGDFAKVVFETDARGGKVGGERMWLAVVRVTSSGEYVGRLDNEPIGWPYNAAHQLGDMITFGPENVIAITHKGKPAPKGRPSVLVRVRSKVRRFLASEDLDTARHIAKPRKRPAKRRKAASAPPAPPAAPRKKARRKKAARKAPTARRTAPSATKRASKRRRSTGRRKVASAASSAVVPKRVSKAKRPAKSKARPKAKPRKRAAKKAARKPAKR